MLHTGLVSVTFRKLSPEEIISLVSKAGLDAIEWGGDIHVPHGNVARADEVRSLTLEAGLKVAAYGSYYKVGVDRDFSDVLTAADRLGAPTIRVWAGNVGSDQADEAWWDKVIEDSKEIASAAQKEGIRISFEYHGNTLTDHSEAALKLMQGINHPNVSLYWQSRIGLAVTENVNELDQISPWLADLHVYQWDQYARLALEEGEKDWMEYFSVPIPTPISGNRYALLEFVKDDRPEQFLQDAEVLKKWVAAVNG